MKKLGLIIALSPMAMFAEAIDVESLTQDLSGTAQNAGSAILGIAITVIGFLLVMKLIRRV